MTSILTVDREIRLLPNVFIVLGGMSLVLWGAPFLTPLFFLIISAYALRGPKESVQALTLLAFLLLFNPGISRVLDNGGSSLRWIVILAAFVRVCIDSFFNRAQSPQKLIRPLLLFSFVMLVFALLVSFIPVISVLKLITFTVGVGTILTSFYRTAHLKNYWISWFLSLYLFVVLASLPFYGTRLGYFRNGQGFQGILNHPQVFGPFVAVIAAFLTGLFIFHRNRSLPVLVGMLLGWLSIYTSLARTALLMAAGSLILSTLLGLYIKPAWRMAVKNLFSGVGIGLIGLFLSIMVLYGPQMIDTATRFLLKDDKGTGKIETLDASFQDSRGFLINQQMENFKNSPITGIGFGVPSLPEKLRIETEGFLELPASASTEKGFMPSAVLEETGIVGAFLVIVFLAALIRSIYRHASITGFILLVACLLVNFGEMVFFSLGGVGLYYWLMIGLSFNLSLPTKPNQPVHTSAVPPLKRF